MWLVVSAQIAESLGECVARLAPIEKPIATSPLEHTIIFLISVGLLCELAQKCSVRSIVLRLVGIDLAEWRLPQTVPRRRPKQLPRTRSSAVSNVCLLVFAVSNGR
jgi:hypothetical protein